MSAGEPQLRQRKHSDRKEVIGDLRADAEMQLKRFIETNGHFSLVRNFHLADAFTVMNGFCGAQSLYMSARFLVTSHPRYMWYALWLPVAGALFDYLDGKIARWRRSSSMLGQELDSLADLVSFGVAPTVAAFALGMREQLDTLIMTVFVCAGIARLARYNITAANIPKDAHGKQRYFEGMPIPSSLLLLVLLGVCLLTGRFDAPQGGAWTPPTDGTAYAYTGRWYSSLAEHQGFLFGSATLDVSSALYALFQLGGGVLPRLVQPSQLASIANGVGRITIHKMSFVWLLWSMAMLSKTLRIPKP